MIAIIEKTAKMPADVRSYYAKLAVVELNDGYTASDVKMISERHKPIKRIIEVRFPLFKGKTEASQYAVTLKQIREDYPGAEESLR